MKPHLKRIRIHLLSLTNRRFLHYGRNFHFGRNTFFFARHVMKIGDDVYIGRNCGIECDCVISDQVIIGNSVNFVGKHDHGIDTIGETIRFSTSVRSNEYCVPLEDRIIVVGRDVWIGCGTIVLSGVEIGEGSVIGAGSVVNCDVPPNSIAVGNPVKVVRQRFSTADFIQHQRELAVRKINNLRPAEKT